MNQNPADLVRLLQSHVLPGAAAVGRLVNAVAIRNGVSRAVFPGSDPNDIAIGRSDADVADGYRGFMIELVLKRDAVIFGLQQTTRRRRQPEEAGILLEHRNGDGAAAHIARANRAPGQRLEPFLWNASRDQRLEGSGVSLSSFSLPLSSLISFRRRDLLLFGFIAPNRARQQRRAPSVQAANQRGRFHYPNKLVSRIHSFLDPVLGCHGMGPRMASRSAETNMHDQTPGSSAPSPSSRRFDRVHRLERGNCRARHAPIK